MIATILAGLACFAVGMATAANWEEILAWLKDCIYSFKELLKTTLKGVANAAKVFIETMGEGIAEIKHKLYYQEEGKWMEQIRARSISVNELPDWAKAKLSREEADITAEIEESLEMTI